MRKGIRGLVVGLLVLAMGCSTFQGGKKGEEGPPPSLSSDFQDISIPSGLKLDKGRSLLFEGGGMKSGYFLYKGRLEPSSLAEYFKNSLTASGWTLLNNFKYGNYVLNFRKGQRSCIILIEEGTLTTKVHIWVGPVVGGATGG